MQTEMLARVRLHLTALGFTTKETNHLVSLYGRWLKCSGIEWSVDRVKSLKQAFYNYLGSESVRIRPPVGWATRKNIAGHVIFKDNVIQAILSRPVKSSDKKANMANLRKIEGFFRTYTAFKCADETRKQHEKMMKAVTAKYTGSITDFSKLLIRHANSETLAKVLQSAKNKPCLPELLGNKGKSSPYVSNSLVRLTVQDIKSARRNRAEAGSWRNLLESDDVINQIWLNHPDEVDSCVGGRVYHDRSAGANLLTEFPAGKLTVIQEGGAKARWVANPFLVYQAFGEGLKWKLDAFIKRLYPEIMTYDQENGLATLEIWVKEEGATVHSYDCKSFTDRFPLKLQEAVLSCLKAQKVVTDFDIDAFDSIVTKPWLLKDGSCIKWEVGQPLGYGPSFHLATLSHAVILDTLNLGLPDAVRGHFMIVGDDVVIKGPELAAAYSQYMEAIGVEIDPIKSMISANFAEFLGKLVSKEGVVNSIKLKELKLPDQLQKAFAFYGRSMVKHIPAEKLVDAYNLFRPIDLGGNGWVMDNISNADWLRITPQAKYARERIQRDIESFFGPVTGARSKELMIQLRSDYYSSNYMSFGCSEHRPLSHETNACERLAVTPVGHVKQLMFERIYGQPTLFTLMDTMLKLEGYSVLSRAPLLTKFGYLNQNEKPYTANHFNGYNDDSLSRPHQGRNSFNFYVARRAEKLNGPEIARFRKAIKHEGEVQKPTGNGRNKT